MQRIAISFWKHICTYKYLLPGTEGHCGEEGEKTHREAEYWGGFSFCFQGKSKRRLGRSPSPFPGPRVGSARTKPLLTVIALTLSSKCTFVIPQLQPSRPGVCPSSPAAFQPCSSSSFHAQGKTCCSGCECLSEGGYMWQTHQNNWLPSPKEHPQAKTWEWSLNAWRLQIPQLGSPFFTEHN